MKLDMPISLVLRDMTPVSGVGGVREQIYDFISADVYNQIVRNFYSPLWRIQYQQLFRPILIELEIFGMLPNETE